MSKWFSILSALCFLASNVYAQAGAIAGLVVAPAGNVVVGATVNAKNLASGAVLSAVSAGQGEFIISGLAEGTYDLAIPSIGFTSRPYSRSGLVLRAVETLRTD